MKSTLFCCVLAVSGATILAGSASGGPRHHQHGQRGPARHAIAALADANHDGAVSPEERAAAREIIRSRMQAKKAKFIERFDSDGDGAISAAEREVVRGKLNERREHRRAHREEIKARIDADGDGSMSVEEREAARASRRDFRAAMKARFDTDNDGAISPAEREAGRNQLKAGDAIAPR